MENNTMSSIQLIAESYLNYRHSVYSYIIQKINKEEDAEDLSQDVFLRLMEYKEMLRPETVKSLVFTIARNLVYDYLRHHYKVQEVNTYLYERAVTYSNETESRVIANDLMTCEIEIVKRLSPQRQKIYTLSRFEDKSVSDISMELNLSQRTVENHLFVGRKEVREYIRQCL